MNSPNSTQHFPDVDRLDAQLTLSSSVAVIGGGFYGCYTAFKLAEQGFNVTVFEQHSELFSGTSGTYGIRLHAGPHYSRSPATRKACQTALRRFRTEFPSLVVPLQSSLYGHGIVDADGLPSRVSHDHFEKVCQECDSCEKVDPEDYGVYGVTGLWDVDEPCLYPSRGRKLFSKLLENHPKVTLVFNHTVKQLKDVPDMDRVLVDGQLFDWAVNCTYFTSFSTQKVVGAQVMYQPCLTLTYEDMDSKRDDPSFMLTITDGWFPCLMPICDEEPERKHNKYMLYHAKYTILGSYDSYDECEEHCKRVSEEWVLNEVRPRMEAHFKTFMPEFSKRFKYTGYLLNTATKLRTATEFRRAVVWKEGRIIHEFSGKLTENILAAEEVLNIIENETSHKGPNLCNDSLLELSSLMERPDTSCDMGVERWV